MAQDLPPPRPSGAPPEARAERVELLAHLNAMLEPLMAGLGLVFLALLLVDYAGLAEGRGRVWLDRALWAVWAVFLVEFVARLAVAPSRLRFLRENWLGALSLALPFLRPLRALRAARALRSLSLVRLIGGVNRGMRVLRRVTGGRRFAYVGALTVLVTLAGAVGVLSFDRGAEGATIRTFGDALWWAAAMVTTINNEKYAVTAEARVLAILLRIYAVSIFGLITASIASYLVGREAEERPVPPPPITPELAALRDQLRLLEGDIAAVRSELRGPNGAGSDREGRVIAEERATERG